MTAWQNQPAPPQPAAVPAYQLAGWWPRAGAIIIDGLIVGLGFLLLFGVLAVITAVISGTGGDILSLLINIASIGGSFAYAFVLMSRKGTRNGQTWGKQVVGIRAVRDNGEDFEIASLLMRELLGKFISGIICYIGYLFPLWDPSNRALHDIIANSHVIMVDKDGNPLAPIAYSAPPQGYAPPQQYGVPTGYQGSPTMVKSDTTLSQLTIGAEGYISTSSMSMDSERGCWLDPQALVSFVAAGPHLVHVQVLGDGYYLKIPTAVAANIAATDASPEGYRSNGWQAAKSIEVV